MSCRNMLIRCVRKSRSDVTVQASSARLLPRHQTLKSQQNFSGLFLPGKISDPLSLLYSSRQSQMFFPEKNIVFFKKKFSVLLLSILGTFMMLYAINEKNAKIGNKFA